MTSAPGQGGLDLFTALGVDEHGLPAESPAAPLAVRMRPQTVQEVLGQSHLLTPGSPMSRLLSKDTSGVSSVILWGPPGTGKTTLAYLIARQSSRRFAEVSAVNAGVKEVRDVIAGARRHLSATGQDTVLFIDEVHRFSKSQQDALLPAVENQWVTLVAATTENPSFSVISPLLSRSLLLVLRPLSEQDIRDAATRALQDPRGYDGTVDIEDDALESLVLVSGSDARKALTLLEASAQAAIDRGNTQIATEDVSMAASAALVRWDQDQHYDVASAFIKSMRGSDVDASLHYLARMIEAGEDPRFIARRIMICAAEDVGMASSETLRTTVAAAQAVALIGFPEASLVLAQAVIAVATAPKSNAATVAIGKALDDVRSGKSGPVPLHLRDSHYSGAKKIGHGQGYKYAHDEPHAVAAQQYLPDSLKDARYYEPTPRGEEALIGKRLSALRDILKMR